MDKFVNYFNHRHRKDSAKGESKKCGPIITISRQAGCDAVSVAKNLVSLLNKKYNTDKWHWIDKEVLRRTASKLETGTHRVESYVKGHELSGFSEMIMAISGKHVSDEKIRKTLSEVVRSICDEGYVVLVGRGGVSLTRQVKMALHVRLVAPFYWRVDNIIKKRQLGIEDAEEFVVDTDEKRYNLILSFLEKKPLNLDYLFDVTLNRNSYSISQLAEAVCVLFEKRIEYLS